MKVYQTVPTAVVSDTAYGSGWDGVTTLAPSANALYDKLSASSIISDSTTTLSHTESTGELVLGDTKMIWTRIGDAVHIYIYFRVVSNTSSDSYLQITNLPYTGSSTYPWQFINLEVTGLPGAGITGRLVGLVYSSNNYVETRYWNGTAHTYLAKASFTAGNHCHISGVYFTDEE